MTHMMRDFFGEVTDPPISPGMFPSDQDLGTAHSSPSSICLIAFYFSSFCGNPKLLWQGATDLAMIQINLLQD